MIRWLRPALVAAATLAAAGQAILLSVAVFLSAAHSWTVQLRFDDMGEGPLEAILMPLSAALFVGVAVLYLRDWMQGRAYPGSV